MKMRSLFGFTLLWASVLFVQEGLAQNAGDSETDRAALVALYEATDGPNWVFNTNWLSDRPLGEWYGVTTDAAGRVTRLQLYTVSGNEPIGNSGIITSNGLNGGIPAELGNLTNLQELDLGPNQLSGSIPAELGNLTNLQQLDLGSNQLSGSIPAELGNLTNLQQLGLYYNQLSGTIPSSLGDLTNLQRLELFYNQLSGSIPAELGNLTNLQQLGLFSNQLSGSIPAELGNLTNLRWLELSYNQLSGTIPSSLGNLANLQHLYLSSNQLSGSIPSSLGNLANLQHLYLSSNQLSGSIPSSLGNLANLQRLSLYDNQLSGTIPSSLGNLANLQSLSLSGNQLSGEIPRSYTSLTALEWFGFDNGSAGLCAPADAAFQDWLQGIGEGYDGPTCAEVGRAAIVLSVDPEKVSEGTTTEVLVTASLDGESLEADVSVVIVFSPESSAIRDEDYFATFDPSSRITIPAGKVSGTTTVSITSIDDDDEEGNETIILTGAAEGLEILEIGTATIMLEDPDLEAISALDRAVLVELYEATNGHNWEDNTNWLSDRPLGEWYGVKTDEEGRVVGLSLSGNELSGAIPSSLGNLANLQWLWLYDNELSGTIPSSLGNLANLQYLGLNDNELSGTLPSSLGNLANLTELVLSGNQLSGAIPSSLGNLSNLEYLFLNENELSGEIPQSYTSLTALEGFGFDNGSAGLCAPRDAAFQEWLQGINFSSGPTCPEEAGPPSETAPDQAVLVELYEATNGHNWEDNTNWLSDAPLGEWYGVSTDEEGRVVGLSLSGNELSGAIPSSLGNLANLQWLWLSDNELSGTIPSSLGDLANLQSLHLYDNELSGAIPSSLGNLANLQYLGLYDNELSGTLPSSLGNLANLTELVLSGNQLSGALPSSLGNLSNLKYLFLNENELSGEIPQSYTSLTALESFAFDNNGLCAPRDAAFQDWLQGINFSSGPTCPEEAGSPSETEESDTVPEKTELKHPRVGSALDKLIARIEAGEISEEEAAQEAPFYRGKSMAVTIYLSSNVDGVVNFLQANGVSARNVGEDYIEAFVPVLLLAEISEQLGVLRVRVIQPPESFEVASTVPGNGPNVHGSLEWNQAGFRGQGIKVGVIDSGFEGIRELLGSELPQTVKGRCYRVSVDEVTNNLQHCENGKDHGTRVAEAIMDIAPEASLYIANPRVGPGDLEGAVDWMISEGVLVINYSKGRVFDGPGDGTSPSSSSPLNIVDRAVERGILWVNSAGNNAQDTWFKRGLSDTDGNKFLEFEDGREEIVATGARKLQLRWAGNWGRETRDLDLYLYDLNGQPVEEGDDHQEGDDGSNPYEVITIKEEGTYKVKVAARGDNLPQWMQLVMWGEKLDLSSGNGSITNPAESTNPGMLTVGAANWRRPDRIAAYSSRGPTPDGQVKPDIVGVDCGETALRSEFCGTSQAAPHVAGMAVLVRQLFPSYTPAEVAAYLKDNAEQRVRSPDPNNIWGHGFAVLPPLPEAPVPPEDPGPGPVDRPALVVLYEATDGENWANNTNWLSNRPLGEWHGVRTDASGRVTRLDLRENQLSGAIPPELENLANLQWLDLRENQLSGAIPSELGDLANLQWLDLRENQLSGSIPPELGGLAKLEALGLFNNQLGGSIPSELENLANLQRLYLRGNELDGCIPAGLRDIENNDFDALELPFCGTAAPMDRAALVALYEATDGENWTDNTNWLSNRPLGDWHGVRTDASGRVTRLDLRENQLSGSIPSELGDLANLQWLDLRKNQLSGSIPPELGGLTKLTWLNLRGNQLSGSIPPELGGLAKLEALGLFNNQLSGVHPAGVGKPRQSATAIPAGQRVRRVHPGGVAGCRKQRLRRT